MARYKSDDEIRAEAIRRADAAFEAAVARGKARYAKSIAATCPRCGERINPDEGGFCEGCFQNHPM